MFIVRAAVYIRVSNHIYSLKTNFPRFFPSQCIRQRIPPATNLSTEGASPPRQNAQPRETARHHLAATELRPRAAVFQHPAIPAQQLQAAAAESQRVPGTRDPLAETARGPVQQYWARQEGEGQ